MDRASRVVPILRIKLGTKTDIGISSILAIGHFYEEPSLEIPLLEILSQGYPGLKLPQSFSFKHHLGKKFSELELQPSDYLLGTNVSEGLDGFPIFYYKNNLHVTLSDILAKTISYLSVKLQPQYERILTSKCIIEIPIYFTDLQRRIVLDAAKQAGFVKPSLVHETRISALNYFDRDRLDRDQLHTICIIDMGMTSMQVCVLKLTEGEDDCKIISHAFDYTLGGKAFNEVLLNYFVIMFRRKCNIDVTRNSEMYQEIYNSCERMKMELSSEKRTWLKINWENYEKWTGCKHKSEWFIDSREWYIDQSVFEDLCDPLLERVEGCLRRALNDAGITRQDIDRVVNVGLASKMPAIVNTMNTFFFRSAILCQKETTICKKRRFRPFMFLLEEVTDIFPYSIAMSLNTTNETTIEAVVFPKGTPLKYTNKEVSFSSYSTFFVDFVYGDIYDPRIQTRIGTFQIGPFRSKTGAKVPGKFIVTLDRNGIFDVKSASISVDGKYVKIPVSRVDESQIKVKTPMGYEEANLLIAETTDNLQKVMEELHEEKEKNRKLQEELAQYQQGSERIRAMHSERRPFYDCEE